MQNEEVTMVHGEKCAVEIDPLDEEMQIRHKTGEIRGEIHRRSSAAAAATLGRDVAAGVGNCSCEQ